MNGTDFPTVAAIVGMTLVTVLTRSFFFLSRRPWRLPAWAESCLRYAPVAAALAMEVAGAARRRAAPPGDPRRAMDDAP